MASIVPTTRLETGIERVYVNTGGNVPPEEGQEILDAPTRARQLLIKNLDERQRKEYYFAEQFVVTAKSGRIYLVKDRLAYNVAALIQCGKSYVHVATLCAFPASAYAHAVISDGTLQIKLLLEARGGEELFLARANLTDVLGPGCNHEKCRQDQYHFIDFIQRVKRNLLTPDEEKLVDGRLLRMATSRIGAH